MSTAGKRVRTPKMHYQHMTLLASEAHQGACDAALSDVQAELCTPASTISR